MGSLIRRCRTGLFTRTFLMVLLGPAVVVGLFAILVIPRQRATMVKAMETRIRGTIASIVRINSTVFIQGDDAGIVSINALMVSEMPDVRYIVTSRHDGRWILSTASRWEEVQPGDAAYRWLEDRSARVIERNPLTHEKVYHYAFPVRFADMDWGWISVGVSMEAYDAQIRRIYLGTAAIGAACLLLSALLAWILARRITAPVLHLKGVAERIQKGELGVRASIRTGDELERLAEAFNATADTLGGLTEALEARVRERTGELQRSEERYRLLFENAAEAILVLKESRVRFFNPVLERLLAFMHLPLARARFTDFVHEDDRMAFLDFMAQAEAKEAPVSVEGLRLGSREGEHLWVNLSCVVTRWDEDPALLLFIQDVSERHNLQVQFFHAQKMEALGTLAGGIAHDFNNLLGGILGYVSLLQMGKDEDSQDFKRLQKIEHQVNSATSLTRQLLGFARGGTYETRPRDINLIVQSAMELFGRTKQELEVVLDLEEDACYADCDRGQIEQVLLNLFVNAAQAMPGGGVLTVATRVRYHDASITSPCGLAPGWFTELEIRDTGVGMDQATLDRIFEPFFTTRKLGGGTGLGLASVYGIVRNHHGMIRVESQPGAGATFTVSLPLAKLPAAEPGQAPSRVLRSGGGGILIVDDQEIIRSVGQEMLERLGYEVHAAESGPEGLALFEANPGRIDLVILDMIMPGMSGSETFRRLRELDPRIPVLLASGYSLEGEVAALLASGCNGFIQKPFNASQLSGKIAEILGVPVSR
jgi:PAS domain S-box-containing protein